MLEDAGGGELRVRRGGLRHAGEVLRHAAERFLADDMLAGRERVADDLRVAGVVGADADRVDLRIGQQFFVVDGTP